MFSEDCYNLIYSSRIVVYVRVNNCFAPIKIKNPVSGIHLAQLKAGMGLTEVS